mmetsp:Transcript_7002/g.22974  ORF Transcript_7002/g.22974 Transcript_7002/m.22974 type:complete len:240 (-) Transcript_7002:2076-2795(-)
MVPASGEKSAAMAAGSMAGSIRRSSACSTIRRFRTPFFPPRSSSSLSTATSAPDLATTRDPLRWKPKWSSRSSWGNIWLPGQQYLARTDPGLSSKPAWMMPELPLVAPCVTSSAASRRSTDAVVRESSRAMAEPMHPAPMITTSYVPSGLADVCRDRERGHARQSPPHRLSLPFLMLKSSAQSSSSTQSPPTYAPRSPCTRRASAAGAALASETAELLGMEPILSANRSAELEVRHSTV